MLSDHLMVHLLKHTDVQFSAQMININIPSVLFLCVHKNMAFLVFSTTAWPGRGEQMWSGRGKNVFEQHGG